MAKYSVNIIGDENMDSVAKYLLKHYKESASLLKAGDRLPLGLTVHTLEIHNETAANPDYVVYVYADAEGDPVAYSGSETLVNSYVEAQELPAELFVVECVEATSNKGNLMKLFKAVRA